MADTFREDNILQLDNLIKEKLHDSSSASAAQNKIYDINMTAARFFYDTLQSSSGAKARQYLADRKITHKTAAHFGIGYADGFTGLVDFLVFKGYSEDNIIKAGLAQRSRKNEKVYNFFVNRVVFPVLDVFGRVVAFGGRVLDDTKPKYLNTKGSGIFDKSSTLFALNFAKHNADTGIIISEGYLDTVTLHQGGFTNAVATLGTALTERHAAVIKGYTDKVTLCYDNDTAGQKATVSAIKTLTAAGLSVSVAVVSGAKDPDEFIKASGAAAFNNVLCAADGATNYLINHYAAAGALARLETEKAMLLDMFGYISALPEDKQPEAFRKLSLFTGIKTEELILLCKDYSDKQSMRLFG